MCGIYAIGGGLFTCQGGVGLMSRYMDFAGSWVISSPRRFLMVTRCLEYLSSGENRAGWAEKTGLPSSKDFYTYGMKTVGKDEYLPNLP